MPPTISVVVPVYNEADFVPEALPTLVSAVEEAAEDYEVIVVENGSTDGTEDAVMSHRPNERVVVISRTEADYGAAMKHGFLEASGDWVVNFDIDYFSADFLRSLLSQPDDVSLVIGSKRDPDSEDRRPLLRRVATKVFNLLLRSILGSKVSDTHGMKGFRRDLIDALAADVVSTQDLYDTELVVRAERSGYTIVEVPVVVEEMRSARSSLISRAPRTVRGLFRIRSLLKDR